MSILVTCPGCKKSFNVDDKFAGKTGACPKCKTKITVPQKQPEVTVHAPEAFGGGGKSVSGKLLLKPIAREQPRIKPLVIAAVVVGIAAVIGYAVFLRRLAPATDTPSSAFDLQHIFCGLGLLLAGPLLCIAAYTFLRDEELQPHRGAQLWLRAAICGLVYAILWAAFAYVRVGPFAGPIAMPIWFVIVPPFVVVGGLAGKFAFDLDTANGFCHYAFYVAATFVLGLIAGVSSAIWS
jgi:hypothetical protein